MAENSSASICTDEWGSDSDDGDKFEWESDGEAEPLSASVLSNLGASGPSTLGATGWVHGEAPSSTLVEDYVGKGFPKEMVLKGIKAIGNNDVNALHELLLTYKALYDSPLVRNCSTSGCTPYNVEDDDDLCFGNWDDDDDDPDGSIALDFQREMLEKDKKIKSLVDVGIPEDEANMIITKCGVGASFFVLVDSKNFPNHEVTNMSFKSLGGRKKARLREESKKKRKRYGGGEQGNQRPVHVSHDERMVFPNPMVGFNLPNDMVRSFNRRLPEQAIGPPFFYYENVALAPKGAWEKISKTLYGLEPEFVDSKYFCAAARKRGYIHNLPIENRAPLLMEPPMTIFEAFSHFNEWWPSWDSRRKLNCLTTCVPSAKLTERIEYALARADKPPSLKVQKYVMDECKRFNLVWVGKNKVAPLEANEMEKLLGFPKDHTRGVGITERYKSLGNSFQVDTVAYHLSVLRDMFPNGMSVLSLFTGIGGAEVALHRLGIHMRTVVSVEISEVNRMIFRSWWNQTQTGRLIEILDVETLTNDIVESLTRKIGGFDLVIGGSPCNNLAGKNRFHRHGLEGEHSVLFYHYFRILDVVKSVMAGI
ncbi:DNA (cytosine-5)-methyltransferase DRM2-like [Lolium rigidum]|uniref:DNA (cytosine-5)-methyltransferase DRM2-like n=1 Tax=Lolium rigidum TaxID=89674 RepID=UPI001F5D993F|nr:DNA (cytosine-5)-methyltransferase DRM2-like [Lolium rigidum]